MAHEINYNEERQSFSFYSLKEIPWHGLGFIAQEAKTPNEVMKIANLDYEVALAPLFASFVPDKAVAQRVIAPDCFQYTLEDGSTIILPKKGERIDTHYATYRKDNYHIFGVVGSRYEIVQNEAALDFIFEVIKDQDVIKRDDIIIQTAGALGNGERIFLTAKLPSYSIAGDDIDKYIVFTSSHDGSGSITAAFTDVRVVCNNTLNMAIHGSTNKMFFKHTKNVKNRLNEAAKLMNEANMYSLSIKEVLERAAEVKIKEKDALRFIEDMFLNSNQKDYCEERGSFINLSNGDNVVPTRTLNRMINVANYIDKGPGQDRQYGTLLWLYNGVTSYLNNGIAYDNNEERFDSLMIGNSAKIAQTAFNVLNNRLSA